MSNYGEKRNFLVVIARQFIIDFMKNIDWREYAVHDENNIKGFFGEYRWLSNFHLAEVKDELGIVYPSTEHAYQAAKTEDPEIREQCLDMTCREVKKWGQTLEIRDGWDDLKYFIMFCLIREKFQNHTELTNKLLKTRWKYLEETNHWGDEFWGVNYKTGKGQNKLGLALQQVRFQIQIQCESVFN